MQISIAAANGELTGEPEDYEAPVFEVLGTTIIFVWGLVIMFMDFNRVIGIFGYTMLGIDES